MSAENKFICLDRLRSDSEYIILAEKSAEDIPETFGPIDVRTWRENNPALYGKNLFRPLRGKKVLLCPTATPAGCRTALDLSGFLNELLIEHRFLLPPAAAPAGWNINNIFALGAPAAFEYIQKNNVPADGNLADLLPLQGGPDAGQDRGQGPAGGQGGPEASQDRGQGQDPGPQAQDAGQDRGQGQDAGQDRKKRKGRAGRLQGQETPSPAFPDDAYFPDFSGDPPTEESGRQYNEENYPFRCLGYDGPIFYYLPDGSQQIVKLRADQHDEKHITALLAPIDFWEKTWTAKRMVKDAGGEYQSQNAGVDWRAIRRFLIWGLQYRRGVYMGDENIRGIGVWKDQKRIVVHLGDRLLIDNIESRMSKIDSKYIYEKKKSAEPESFSSLPLADANKLQGLIDKIKWSRDINSRLLSGWIVASLIGGALPWRPHIWLNGPQSCGKSSILKDIIRRVTGNCTAIYIEGATTEAGLRQQANHCSFPILFDEAESSDRKGQIRMEQIIELMRSSASPEGGKIVKGSSSGIALSFDVQSCFCLASISNNATLSADVARIVNIEMRQPDPKIKWEVFHQEIIDTLNPEWAGRFRARVFKMVPVIRQNIDIFIKAVRDELDSQRYGDVYGVLLGSAYSIFSDTVIDEKAARKWVKDKDWTEERRLKSESDEGRALCIIMQRIVTIRMEGLTEDKTLWDLIKEFREMDIAEGKSYLDPFSEAAQIIEERIKRTKEYHKAAKRYGVAYKREGTEEFIIIYNTNRYLEYWLKDTPYYPNWHKYLKRISGEIDGVLYEARQIAARQYTKEQPSSRGIMIPYKLAENIIDQKEEIAQ